MVKASAILTAAGLLIPLLAEERTVWNVEVVDRAGSGNYNSLRLDKQGNAHLAYVAEQGDQHSLRYAFWDRALRRWFVMPVSNWASFSSLTLDSNQKPHISFADYGTGSGAKLRHARWDGTSWKITPLPLDSETIGYYTSIALDPEDRPNISFYEYDGRRGTNHRVRMRVVSWNGKYWEVKTVDQENQSGKFNSIAIDSQSRLHLAYANVGATTAGLRYAIREGGNWRSEIIEDLALANETVGQAVFITLDKHGNPHIVYSNSSRALVKYAFRKDDKWVTQTVDQIDGIAYPDRYSMVLAEDQTPYISYFDPGAGVLKVASRQGSQWVIEVVDQGGVGFTSSLEIHDGQIWVAYADGVNGATKVARRTLTGKAAAPPSTSSSAQATSVQGTP